MTKQASEIKTRLRVLFGDKAEILDGWVQKVDEDAFRVDIKTDENVTDYDVKLRSASDQDKAGLVCIPSVGSYVVYGKVEGANDYVLLKTSKLDKVLAEIGDAKLVMTKDGFEIRKNGVSLKNIFADLKTLLTNFKVLTPSGPSTGLTPDTITALAQLETKFNTLLNA